MILNIQSEDPFVNPSGSTIDIIHYPPRRRAIGETIIGRETIARQIAAPVLGSVIYYQLISLGLAIGLKPADLKLATGVFVLLTLALPALRKDAQQEVMRG